MKRSIFLLFVLVTFMGCEETALRIEEPVVKKITINASVKGGGGVIDPVGITSITAGSKMTYKIYPTKGYNLYSVFVDGVDKTSEVSENTFNLKNEFSSNIEFEFIHQDKFNIQSDYWNLKGLKQYLDGVLVVDQILSEEQLSNKYYFYQDGKTIAYHINGTPFGGPFDWIYFENPKSIKINQTVFSITEITATSFSYRDTQVTPLGQTLESVHEYTRPKK